MTITDKQVEAALAEWFSDNRIGVGGDEEFSIRMCAALEAAEAAREPADFVMVPRELTTEMLDASESAAWATREQLGRDASFDSYLHAYVQAQWRAALKAAPKSAAPGSAEQPHNVDDAVTAALHRPPNGQAGESTNYCQGWRDACAYIAESRNPAPGAPEADERKEQISRMLWDRFAPDHHIEWADEPRKAEYRSAAANILAAVPSARAQSSAAPVSEQAGPPSAAVWAAVWAARELGEVRDAARAEYYTEDGDVIIERPSWERLLDALDNLPGWYAADPQMPPVSARDGEDARRYRRISHALSTGDAELYDTRLIANDRVHDLDIDSFADGLPPADRAMGDSSHE